MQKKLNLIRPSPRFFPCFYLFLILIVDYWLLVNRKVTDIYTVIFYLVAFWIYFNSSNILLVEILGFLYKVSYLLYHG